MTEFDYDAPVSKLITLGDVGDERTWRDYAALGLTADHIPELIRLALDEELMSADSEGDEVWACIHAWRALGQLRAVDAVEPLISLFDYLSDDLNDWISDDLPEVFALIGPAAIHPLRVYLADSAHGIWARVAAATSLLNIAGQHPGSRDEVIAILSAQLEHHEEQDRKLNACLVGNLAMDLHAVEAAPVIERAYAAGKVDISFMGDWEDAQIKLGLLTERLTPKPDYMALEMPEFAETRDRLRSFFEQRVQPAHKPAQKPGRNDPCWCGSGKKYKQCHLQADRET